MFLTLVLLSVVIHQRDALPVSSDTEAMKYLLSFSYLDPALLGDTSTSFVSGDTVRRAISDFQSFASLNPTGELDKETSIWMSKPRCGVPDITHEGDSIHQQKRNNVIKKVNRWSKKNLTYRITKYTKHLKKSDVDQEIAKAFQMWAEVTELTFALLETGRADIDIRFESGIHDDNDKPFDGPGGFLAHSTYPESGKVHFDDDETWTINDTNGTDLFQVATHQIGHALGLGHSKIISSVMKPFYDGYKSDFKLNAEDIEKIQQLYGKSVANSWIKEKFNEVETALEKLGNEFQEVKRELAGVNVTTDNLKTTLNGGLRWIYLTMDLFENLKKTLN